MLYRIALAQERSVPHNVSQNVARVAKLAAEASLMESDLLLLPECFLTSYDFPISQAEALDPTSPVFDEIATIARNENLAIVATAFTRGKEAPRNSAIVFNKAGERVFQYDKVHTCDWDLEGSLESGEKFSTAEVDGVKLGLMICYDREYPEAARVLMLQGAELILVPNHCSGMGARLRALATRAYENMTGVAMANPPGLGMGRSAAYSPIVWAQDETDLDPEILLAPEQEAGLFLADFDLDELRSYRKREMMGNTYRKVHAYGELLNPSIEEPFLRPGQRK